MPVKPREKAPALDLPLSNREGTVEQLPDGGGRFTLVVFFRGLHCPVCHKQLEEVQSRLGELAEAGITRVVAVSAETEQRSARLVEKWGIDELPVAYGLDVAAAQEQWGLYASRGIKDGEPDLFTEPGMAIVENSDSSVLWLSVQSMPWGRPRVESLIKGVTFVQEEGYPARGEV